MKRRDLSYNWRTGDRIILSFGTVPMFTLADGKEIMEKALQKKQKEGIESAVNYLAAFGLNRELVTTALVGNRKRRF